MTKPYRNSDLIRKFTAGALGAIFLVDLIFLVVNHPSAGMLVLSGALWCIIGAWAYFFIRQETRKRRPPTPPRLLPRFYVFFYFSWVCLLSGLILVRAANSGVEFYSGLAAVLVLFPGALWMARLRI